MGGGGDGDLDSLAQRAGVRRAAVAVFPPSTSRETELFERLFPEMLPPGTNLMVELIQAVRSGKIDLAPGKDGGWYQYQAHALETFLLPSRGQEEPKLLLTASYKKRLIEAFQALITKRRETHARQLDAAKTKSEAAPLGEDELRPRLRVEPCATFYLRTARAYGFLQDFLLATVGQEHLARLYGLREGGQRDATLAAELDRMRSRFYGFYLVACEDIGLKPQFLADEPVDQVAAKLTALDWLAKLGSDRDLACDTRVSVPILRDLRRRTAAVGHAGCAAGPAGRLVCPAAASAAQGRQCRLEGPRAIPGRGEPLRDSPGRVRRDRSARLGQPDPRRAARSLRCAPDERGDPGGASQIAVRA